jgi:hypothetical protein
MISVSAGPQSRWQLHEPDCAGIFRQARRFTAGNDWFISRESNAARREIDRKNGY